MSDRKSSRRAGNAAIAAAGQLAAWGGIATRFVFWLTLLAAVLPAISREWTFAWSDPALSPADYLTTSIGFAYLGFCALVVLAFVLFGRQRRLVYFAFAAVLISVQLETSAIGWDRVAIVLAVIAILVILVETVRQNLPLYRELRRNDELTLRILGQSLVLWSPLLLIIFIGVLANQKLLESTERLVYDTTPIDEWCEVSDGKGAQIIPCAGMGGTIAPDELSEVPHDVAITRHTQLRMSQTTSELLAAIASAEPPEWLGGGLERAGIQAMVQRMHAIKILDIEAGPDPATTAVGRDEQIKKLNRRITAVQRQISRTSGEFKKRTRGLDRTFMAPVIKKALADTLKGPRAALAALKRARAAREAQVRARAAKEEQASADGAENALRRQISKALIRVKAGLDGRQQRHIEHEDLDERKNRLMAFVIRSMDRIEKETLRVVLPLAAKRKYDALFYSALLMTPRCTAERVNEDVRDKDGNATLINRGEFRCFADHPDAGLVLTPAGLRTSADLSIDRWQSESEIEGLKRLRALSSGSYKSADDAAEAGKDVGNAAPSTIDLGRKECHLITNPINCITNFVKGKTEEGYAGARAKLGRNLDRTVDQKTDAAARSVDAEIIAIRDDMYRTLDGSAGLMRVSVARMQQLGNVLSILLTLFLIVAVIKSFLYVLATRIFDAKGNLHIDIGPGEPVQGEYVAGTSISIPRSFAHPLITREVLDNQENSTALMPWPFSAPISRILRGVYFVFNKGGQFEHGEGEMSFTRVSGSHVIDWRMKEGEEVVFHYANFFGASDNVRLKTTISLRLATILLGRFVFHSAVCTEGDGRLLLTAKGTVSDEAKTDSTTVSRLIAWNKHARFRVSSKGTIKAVFLDGYTIMRMKEDGKPSGLIVVEAIGDGGKKIIGAVRFIRTLLLPF